MILYDIDLFGFQKETQSIRYAKMLTSERSNVCMGHISSCWTVSLQPAASDNGISQLRGYKWRESPWSSRLKHDAIVTLLSS